MKEDGLPYRSILCYLECIRNGLTTLYQIDSLLKLEELKSTDGTTNFLQYFVLRLYDKFPETLSIVQQFEEVQAASREMFSILDNNLAEMHSGMQCVSRSALYFVWPECVNVTVCSGLVYLRTSEFLLSVPWRLKLQIHVFTLSLLQIRSFARQFSLASSCAHIGLMIMSLPVKICF